MKKNALFRKIRYSFKKFAYSMMLRLNNFNMLRYEVIRGVDTYKSIYDDCKYFFFNGLMM